MRNIKRGSATLTLLWFCLLAGSGWVMPGQAKVVENLFSAEVEVSSQSRTERQQAIRQAFQQVVIKLTGLPSVTDNQAIRTAQRQVNDYLLQYGYKTSAAGLRLTARFDERKVKRLLADNNLPYWGRRRPELLLWVARENEEGRRQLVGSRDESVFTQQLRFFAGQAGIPIQLPLQDLNDAMTVSATDVWGRFLAPVRQAGQRYDADGFVIARISYNADPEAEQELAVWTLNWSAYIDQQRLSGEVSAASQDWLAEPFVQQLQQQLAAAFSVTRSAEKNLIALPITIKRLSDWRDIIALESFLESIVSVNSVTLTRYSTEQSEFLIEVQGSADHLLQSIQLDGRLQLEQVSPFINPDEEQTPSYIWVSQ
ncbi:DUF2066 domain-containing protein [Idiomarina seosinensis]|uniref:DUF2066 domain-containing protein n=1 Tax=Idiomarina seosinensis TaxID=281739 RepID=UPI00384AA9A5